MIALSPNEGWSIVNISQLGPGATKSVAEFTCGGVLEFKLTHYHCPQRRLVSTQQRLDFSTVTKPHLPGRLSWCRHNRGRAEVTSSCCGGYLSITRDSQLLEIEKEKSFRDDMCFNSPVSERHTSILQTHCLSVEPKSGVGEGTLSCEEGAVFRCRV